jgi:hypothetical protein
MIAVLAVDSGQQPVSQPVQRARAERLSPRARRCRGGHPVRPLPRHQRQLSEQRLCHLGVIRVRHQRHQQHEPDRQRWRERPRDRRLLPAFHHDLLGNLINHAGRSGQLVQPPLRNAQTGVISRVPGSLHPPVAAHHRRRHRYWPQPDHQVSGAYPPGAGCRQRPPAVAAQPLLRRRGQVSYPDRDHACLGKQAQRTLFCAAQDDLRRHGRDTRARGYSQLDSQA